MSIETAKAHLKSCPILNNRCKGNDCMMWRWDGPNTEYYSVVSKSRSPHTLAVQHVHPDAVDFYSDDEFQKHGPKQPKGYCGLAGKLSVE